MLSRYRSRRPPATRSISNDIHRERAVVRLAFPVLVMVGEKHPDALRASTNPLTFPTKNDPCTLQRQLRHQRDPRTASQLACDPGGQVDSNKDILGFFLLSTSQLYSTMGA